jgi:hypothetical protein
MHETLHHRTERHVMMPLASLLDGCGDVFEVTLHHRVEKRLLVRVVLVQRAHRDAGPLRHAGGGQTLRALAQQNLNGGFEYRVNGDR